MNYLEMNTWFIVPVLAWYFIRFRATRIRQDSIALAILMLMTAVFDNLIILAGIVSYDESKLSGVKIFVAPIEDFAYTLVLVALIALAQSYLAKSQSSRKAKK